MYKALIVGGTFDRAEGRPSGVVRQLAEATGWPHINGGSLASLQALDLKNYDVVVWMPNIDNFEEKTLMDIKQKYPTLTLISSKRVVEKDYTAFDVVTRLLKSRSNLGIMIQQKEGRYTFRLLDPLGNQFCDTDSIQQLGLALKARVDVLRSLTRLGSESVGPITDDLPKPEASFISLVRSMGDEFSRHVNAINTERFLGNASARVTDRITRCCHGFPAFRAASHYLVSRRNVDKATMSAEDFIPVLPDSQKVWYYGANKPSVDAPIQIRLLNYYTNVNYIVHGHVYVADAPMTKSKVPCGHIEEFGEVADLFPSKESSNFSLNLKGHGCLILARDMPYLQKQKSQLISRPFPEP